MGSPPPRGPEASPAGDPTRASAGAVPSSAAKGPGSGAPLGVRRWQDRILPIDTDEPFRRSGFASDSRRDHWYLLAAFGIAIAMASIWGWIVSAAPVPPGGDPSTWILPPYPYVGLPTTTGIQPLGYPPGSFPFVGLAVVLGGGPLVGGRLFIEGAIIALGVAAYFLGRS